MSDEELKESVKKMNRLDLRRKKVGVGEVRGGWRRKKDQSRGERS